MSVEHFERLFNPKGVVVVGASTHPGKFGFVALHNILANGYKGRVFATNRDGAEVLGVQTLTSLDDLPAGEVDLAFVCTPAATNLEVLSQLADRGVATAFIASAGYGEAGEEGRAAQAALVAAATELGKAALAQGIVEWSTQALAAAVKFHGATWLVGGALQALSAAYLTRVVGRAMADVLALSAGVSEPDLARIRLEAPLLVARAAGRCCCPRNTGLKGSMPAMVSSTVGSSGTREALAMRRCSRAS